MSLPVKGMRRATLENRPAPATHGLKTKKKHGPAFLLRSKNCPPGAEDSQLSKWPIRS